MNRTLSRLCALTAALLLLPLAPALAQSSSSTVAHWNPSGDVDESGMPATSTYSGYTASTLAHSGNGLSSYPAPGSYAVQGWSGAQTTNQYVQLTVTPPSGKTIAYDQIQLGWYAGLISNPDRVAVRTSLDGYASNVATARHPTSSTLASESQVSVSLANLAPTTGAVTFRLYFWASQTQAGISPTLFLDGSTYGQVGLKVLAHEVAAGFVVSPTSGLATTEAGGTDSFTVQLTRAPSADVTVSLSSSDTGEATVDKSSLTFSAANWSTAQTVTVTGVDDALDDGDQAFTIALGAATSSDADYQGLDPADVSGSNADDDEAAGITVTPTSGLQVTEGGSTATFTVALTSQPTADVTVPVSSSDAGEARVDKSSLTFTAANWSTAQTVTVTGVDDAVDDGDQAFTIALGAASSGDAAYQGLDPADVSGSNADDDTAGATITPTSGLEVTEAGSTATFQVVLTSQPTADVRVTLYSLDTGEATLDTNELTFTAASWSTAQTVTVTGVDDAVDDGDQAVTITTHTFSNDIRYFLDPPNVSVTVRDDDAAGFTVTPTSGLEVTEAGSQATFTVALTSQPLADVTVPLSSGDAGEASVSTASLTFSASNWSAAQTVTITGVDDAVDDGDQALTVALAAATSADGGYQGLDPADVSVTVLDDDTAAVVVTPTSGLRVAEGGTATFQVVLTSEPTEEVRLSFYSSDTGEATLDLGVLSFTASNWSTPQVVTITGVDDAVDDGDQAVTIVARRPRSYDLVYRYLLVSSVSLTVLDDDTAGVQVTPASGLQVTEAGSQATFQVALTSQPLADVTVSLSSGDAGEATLDTNTLSFTSASWSTAQTVTITGVDDAVDDGDQTVAIALAATSVDGGYQGLELGGVSVSVQDDDAAGLVLGGAGPFTLSEVAGVASFTVALQSQPTADVTIAVVSSDTSEVGASPASLTFTAADWSTPQRVTLQGVDDDVQDGDQLVTVSLAPAGDDALYTGLAPGAVQVTVLDDDRAGVTVSPRTGLTSGEDGAQASFTVVLESRPTAAVEVRVAGGDAAEVRVSPRSLTFEPAAWDQPQTVAVEGLDDDLVDGDQEQVLTLSLATEAAEFADVDPGQVVVVNRDDDLAALSLADASVGEGAEGDRARLVFALTLSAPVRDELRVPYQALDGSAEAADGDYEPAQGVLIVPAGERAASIAVTVRGDARVEGDEVLLLRLGTPSAGGLAVTLGDGEARGTIVDDDQVRTRRSLLVGDVTGDGRLDAIGVALAADLDLDGDGAADRRDVGAIYVWAGRSEPSGRPTAVLRRPDAVDGDRLGEAAGQGVQLADVSGDGVLDLVVGASGADVDGVADCGAVFVWEGGAALLGDPEPLATLVMPGAHAGDRLGDSAGQGIQLVDLNADGLLDLVAGASAADLFAEDDGGVAIWAAGPGLRGRPAPLAVLGVPGAAAGDRLGESSGQGVRLRDLDGDGLPEVVAGASGADVRGVADAGAVYVWPGATLVGTPAPGCVLTAPDAAAGDRLGETGGLGIRLADVSGDGACDVIVGAASADAGALADAGAIYVWSGAPAATAAPAPLAVLRSPAPAEGARLGEAGGRAVQTVDVDGDGVRDLLVACADPGRIEVWRGGPSLQGSPALLAELRLPAAVALGEDGFRLADLTGDGRLDVIAATSPGAGGLPAVCVWEGGELQGVRGPTALLEDGSGLAGPGWPLQLADVTGDAVLDVIAVASRAEVDGVHEAGAVHVWAGGAALRGACQPLATLTAPGALPGDRLGEGVGRGLLVADLDGDGVADLLAAAPRADLDLDGDGTPERADTGALYAWSGGDALQGRPAPSFVLRVADAAEGDRLGEASGQGVLLADLDGDALPEIVAGAQRADAAGEASGAVYVWRGGSSASPAELAPAGAAPGEHLGLAAGQGVLLADVTGDGRPDVLAAGMLASRGAPAAGAIHAWSATALAGGDTPLLADHPLPDDRLGG